MKYRFYPLAEYPHSGTTPKFAQFFTRAQAKAKADEASEKRAA